MLKPRFFGYGSLLNLDSLRATVPSASELAPSYIKGFKRDFSQWNQTGFQQVDLEFAGIPYCAIDVYKLHDAEARVNGVTFAVDPEFVDVLIEREHGYKILQTPVYHYDTNEPLGECFVFSANKQSGNFAFNNAAQIQYLQTCLDGAKSHGNLFYEEFLQTTYIGDMPLHKHPAILLP